MPDQKAECSFNDSALNFNVTKVPVAKLGCIQKPGCFEMK